jgi:glycyl-tRNA synthetase beta chain
VVGARLADAQFFYDEDRKVGLPRRSEQLSHLAFHDKLGSYADKAERMAALSAHLCARLGWPEERPQAYLAARLLKADLATDVVKEFTSLQGIVGGIYAREEGHPEEIWQAIYDQYLPASTEDRLPRGRIGRVVGLADRIDTLAGIFGLGLVPTGSKDPFGLRRAAQGAVRIALEGGMPVDLEELARKAIALYGERISRPDATILGDLRPFLADRIRYLLGLAGFAYDEIEAALVVGGANLPDLKARVAALHDVRGDASFLTVVQAAKRIANITKGAAEQPFEEALFAEPAEKELAAAFAALRAEIDEAAAAGDYKRCLRRIADLAPVLDKFFVDVLVMAEDEKVRRNRIALLQAIGRSVSRTARLTEVVVDRSEGRA